ncbi:spermidine synthase [Nocardioides sp. MH1]|uniref:spermidine synthase n=1 Tax=Nocardioides sp. MH1 TaxID=3242490 RepID=UPI0035208910
MEPVARDVTDRGELVLRRRDDGHLELRANGVFVMDTLEHTSEDALAARALAVAGPGSLSVLVGGLGLGYTLAATLANDRVTRCVVAEIEPALVGWLRDGTVPHGPGLLADPRVEVVVGDVADALRSAREEYDVVLLDVDNGPAFLVHDDNARLYGVPLLTAARDALRPGGTLVVWSAAAAPDLEAALRHVLGNAAEERCPVPAHGRVGDYFLYLARRPA